MREYEFAGNDVVADMLKLIQESVNANRANLSECIEKDKVDFCSFIDMAEGYSVSESELTVGNYYCPIMFSVTFENKNINLLTVIKLAKFDGITGSRLRFTYDNCNRSMFFPADTALRENWIRCIYIVKDHLDQTIVNLALKFRGTEWTITALGYDANGVLGTITNI
jgi:hypothetical protein